MRGAHRRLASVETRASSRAVRHRRRTRILGVEESLQRRTVRGVALAPCAIVVLAVLAIAVFCSTLLEEAARSRVSLPSLVPLFGALLGVLAATALVVWFQAVRMAQRLAGPAFRLVKSLQRMREGDISFRVHLRRGDHLTDVAAELNNVLDWLNQNPPRGARTGGDLVQVGRREKSPAPSQVATPAAAEVLP